MQLPPPWFELCGKEIRVRVYRVPRDTGVWLERVVGPVFKEEEHVRVPAFGACSFNATGVNGWIPHPRRSLACIIHQRCVLIAMLP